MLRGGWQLDDLLELENLMHGRWNYSIAFFARKEDTGRFSSRTVGNKSIVCAFVRHDGFLLRQLVERNVFERADG